MRVGASEGVHNSAEGEAVTPDLTAQQIREMAGQAMRPPTSPFQAFAVRDALLAFGDLLARIESGDTIRIDKTDGEWPYPVMDFERTPDPTQGPFIQVVEDRGWNIGAGAYLMIALDELAKGG